MAENVFRQQSEYLNGGRVQRFILSRSERPLSYADVIQLWQSDESFRNFFIQLLAEVSFAAYFWETPPLTQANRERPFEFVLVESPQLAAVQAEPRAFAAYFSSDPVVDFANLGGDAYLVAPCPQSDLAAYPHLAAFSRKALQNQQHHFWQRVGAVTERRIGERPLWLSTSGLGVYWLHIRLDSWPKYYTYRPFRE